MFKYEFKKEDAFEFANRQHIQAKPKDNELQFVNCPYCRGGKHRDKGSFSISLDTGQYKCLRESCGAKGNFVTLARDFDFSLGNDFDRYYSNKAQFKKFNVKSVPTKDHAVELMQKRGISEATTRKYELTVAENYGADVIAFSFFDENSDLKFIKYRNMNFNKAIDKNKEWCEPGCMPILFGMKQCNGTFDRLIITEGQIDSLSVSECEIENAVSVPTGAKGFTWVPYCWDWFSKFKELIVFGDCEKGHISLLDELKKRFPGAIRNVRIEHYKGCKDANEMLQKLGKQSIVDAINNATMIPVKRVRELADVKPKDLENVPRIKTGFRSVDNSVLGGGLYGGQMIILTGKRGDGKSTVAGEMMKSALEQGKKVFAYSGELPDWFFKRWLDFQIAGPQNIVENVRQDKSISRFITNSTVDKLNDWYRGRAFIYDNNVIEDEELEDLVGTIEKSVMQYGIDLVLVDNLMTALDVGMDSDLNRSQGKFVKKLSALAKKLEVVIILVVHPRKNKFGSDENDEVSGSADITNLADIVMTYKRDKDASEEENTRLLSISKNRWFGKFTKGNGVTMYYEEKSKRISDIYNDFGEPFGLEQEKFSKFDQEELPFDKLPSEPTQTDMDFN